MIAATHWAWYNLRYMVPGLNPHPHMLCGHRMLCGGAAQSLFCLSPWDCYFLLGWQSPTSLCEGVPPLSTLLLSSSFLISCECGDLPTQIPNDLWAVDYQDTPLGVCFIRFFVLS